MSAVPNHIAQTKIKFVKMSGAGNDFVIFDARHNSEFFLSQSQIQKIANRKIIGCDQLIILKKPSLKKRDDAEGVRVINHTNTQQVLGESSVACGATSFFKEGLDCLMEIYNSDGSLSGACGNATRCVAAILFSEQSEKSEINIQTSDRILKCWRADENLISVNMGIPNFDWQKIPLSKQTNSQKISLFDFDFACVNVGNPHAVTFINSPLSDEKFFEIGAKVETNPIFPQKTNVEFAQILSDNLIEVRVWERGAGETLACGSGACAVGVLAIKNYLSAAKKITIRFKGGDLAIEWNGLESAVIMTGGYEKIFAGELDESFFN